jgi:hypothetical protein
LGIWGGTEKYGGRRDTVVGLFSDSCWMSLSCLLCSFSILSSSKQIGPKCSDSPCDPYILTFY